MTSRVHLGEYEWEPVRGLPERLPEGERVLWQGSPCWRSLAIRAFHARKVALYFALLVGWRIAAAVGEGETARAAAASVATLVGLGAAAVAILVAIAWLNARATVYTITDRRVVSRFGVALTLALNLPYAAIESAGFREHADGTGDLPLSIRGASEIGYLMLWPHVRPWRLGARVEPMLRAVPGARGVAETLARALAAASQRAPVPLEEAAISAPPAPDAAALS